MLYKMSLYFGGTTMEVHVLESCFEVYVKQGLGFVSLARYWKYHIPSPHLPAL